MIKLAVLNFIEISSTARKCPKYQICGNYCILLKNSKE
ncbi:hypothetical protein LEP1GSC186_1462 [Leptospira noguchii serovar Autumnalis str. ZUN142]|uniref:Uncharacterized protein n=1 Tax=Leptospira noguchii serovar Autumnalis str. ZUN142 TaxID=1085540 RepID=M6U4T2_9LEPT|nr:hypothetical protein LEP1GSC072_1171 [Leptospira noguchii str. Bonito]EMO40017.1 hypothetical protein LEP1GSC186_1462 [Leptospira noguchii serovar Autumnalis str. ZUN142]